MLIQYDGMIFLHCLLSFVLSLLLFITNFEINGLPYMLAFFYAKMWAVNGFQHFCTHSTWNNYFLTFKENTLWHGYLVMVVPIGQTLSWNVLFLSGHPDFTTDSNLWSWSSAWVCCFNWLNFVSEIGNVEITVTSNFSSNVSSGGSGKKTRDEVLAMIKYLLGW